MKERKKESWNKTKTETWQEVVFIKSAGEEERNTMLPWILKKISGQIEQKKKKNIT